MVDGGGYLHTQIPIHNKRKQQLNVNLKFNSNPTLTPNPSPLLPLSTGKLLTQIMPSILGPLTISGRSLTTSSTV